MGDLVLVTGGSRSGKSALAQRLGEAIDGPRTFIATCPLGDDEELAARVRRHQQDRAAAGWSTIEEPVTLAAALRRAGGDVRLVDCLTLWVSNLMWQAAQSAPGQSAASDDDPGPLSEDDVAGAARELVDAARQLDGTTVLVTNEVGLGVVPTSAVARRYRDLVGRCNQTIAAAADVVLLTVCGLPLVLKGADHRVARTVSAQASSQAGQGANERGQK